MRSRLEALKRSNGTERQSTARLHRIEAPLSPVEVIPLLHSQTLFPKVFWRDRNGAFEAAGIGAAHVVRRKPGERFSTVLKPITALLRPEVRGARYYGGFSFNDASAAGEEWRAFGSGYFVLPQFELISAGEGAVLSCNVYVPADGRPSDAVDEALRLVDQLVRPPADGGLEGSLPPLAATEYTPDFVAWQTVIERALEAFADSLTKVVLARKVAATFEQSLDPIMVLQRLIRRTSDAFRFCLQPAPNVAFLGCSPERLYRRKGSGVWSEALAGTRKRGATQEEDRALAQDLLTCEKDLREHAIVRDRIKDAFERLCAHIDGPGDIDVARLRGVQHLYCSMAGRLRDGVSDGEILEAMHPTPAVGGYPTDRAMAAIAELEPFARGWYAGPIGWIGTGGAEMAVAIRSGLVNGNTLTVWTGNGIVPGSAASTEWDELEIKLSNFADVLHPDEP